MAYSEEYYRGRANHPMGRAEAQCVAGLAGPEGHGTVIDAGCGSGELLERLGPQRGIGLDLNATAIEMAHQRLPQYEFSATDACRPPVPAGSVDCIVSMHLIEHLPDLAPAMEGWHAALRAGGKLVLITPNAAFRHPEVFSDPDHKHIYDGEELRRIVNRSGFAVEKVFTLGLWGFRNWPLLWRISPMLQRLELRWPIRWRGQSLALSARRL